MRLCSQSALTGLKIRHLSDTTQTFSRSPTNISNYHDDGRKCLQHSTNRRNDYCITHRHRVSRWTIRSRDGAAPLFQSID